MKNMKKILALVLAMMLVLGMTAALADDPAGRTGGTPLTDKTITLTNPSAGHTYTLYQIFTGTFQKIDGQDTLGDVAYGNGIALTEGKYDGKTAEELAETITNSEAGARAFANTIDSALQNGVSKNAADKNPSSLVWDGLTEGYYIIKDTTANLAEGEEHDLVVVQVLDDVTITAKAGTVEFDKKVADRNDSTMKPTVYDAWGNTSDYDVGDNVPYQVTIKLPANFTSYVTYQMTMHDDMEAGLQFNDDVEIFAPDGTKLTSGYEVKKNSNGHTFEIAFAEVVGMTGADDNAQYTITYSAKLTGENVVYGNPGNHNEAWLTYSNNPTTGGEGGTTPHKTTVTFTYKFEVDKIDQDYAPLKGAAFTLYKKIMPEEGEATYQEIKVWTNTDGNATTFSFDGIDDGDYKLVETVVPAGYNKVDDIEFTVTAEHGVEITNLEATNGFVGKKDGGEFTFTKPGDDTKSHTITEDKAAVAGVVVNQSGVELPSTGGIGTTIFYIGGGILILAAVILLVTKRRMNAND